MSGNEHPNIEAQKVANPEHQWRIGIGASGESLANVRSVNEPPERWFNTQSVAEAERLCWFLNHQNVNPDIG